MLIAFVTYVVDRMKLDLYQCKSALRELSNDINFITKFKWSHYKCTDHAVLDQKLLYITGGKKFI